MKISIIINNENNLKMAKWRKYQNNNEIMAKVMKIMKSNHQWREKQ